MGFYLHLSFSAPLPHDGRKVSGQWQASQSFRTSETLAQELPDSMRMSCSVHMLRTRLVFCSA
jgi:hypothetical protein